MKNNKPMPERNAKIVAQRLAGVMPPEIAEQLNCSLSAVTHALNRATAEDPSLRPLFEAARRTNALLQPNADGVMPIAPGQIALACAYAPESPSLCYVYWTDGMMASREFSCPAHAWAWRRNGGSMALTEPIPRNATWLAQHFRDYGERSRWWPETWIPKAELIAVSSPAQQRRLERMQGARIANVMYISTKSSVWIERAKQHNIKTKRLHSVANAE